MHYSPAGAIPRGFRGVTIEKLAHELTKEEAIEISESKWWETLPSRDVALAQLAQPMLCMKFSDFQKAVETAAGRGVFTREFVDPQRLIDEING